MSRGAQESHASIAALASARGRVPPFLSPHHIEAARRVQGLFERAQLRPNVTMHYAPRVSASRGGDGAAPVTDMAMDARKRLNRLMALLPRDCATAVIDICGFEKALGEVERERQWPRRSAKLILRAGLDALAIHMGLSVMARGPEAGPQRRWGAPGAKPTEIG